MLQIKALCKIIPRQIKAEEAVTVIQRTVEDLIAKCKAIVEMEGERIDEEEYVNDADPSILRFLRVSALILFNYSHCPLLCMLNHRSRNLFHAYETGSVAW